MIENETKVLVPPFEQLFTEHIDRVFRTLRYSGVSQADVPDVAQEVFLTIHRLLPTFEPRAKITTWIYAISVNAARQHLRRAHVRKEVVGGDSPEIIVEASQDEHLSRVRATTQLFRVLDGLDEDKRAVFVLYEIENSSMADIAESLSVPVQTAYSRLHAARKYVETEFAKWREEGNSI